MKRVVGIAGDRFCWRPDMGTHFVGTSRMPPPSPEALALGLRPWLGCRLLEGGEVVGYGASADSYDSRYLDPFVRPSYGGSIANSEVCTELSRFEFTHQESR